MLRKMRRRRREEKKHYTQNIDKTRAWGVLYTLRLQSYDSRISFSFDAAHTNRQFRTV
jgi:hypothetical protein